MFLANYHSHCTYCDGKEPPEAYVQAALQQKLSAYGFSSHAPLPYDIAWAMKQDALASYVADIRQLQQQYAGQIELYLGLEVDFIPGVAGPGRLRLPDAALDYTVGSVHFVDAFADGRPWEVDGRHQMFLHGLQEIFDQDIRQAVARYYALIRQMVTEDCPSIVGHLDKIKIQSEDGQLFSEQADWYRQAVRQTLEIIAQSPAVVEINTRGMYKKLTAEPYPSYWILEQMRALDIPVMLSADAHRPEEITACFREVIPRLRAMGYDRVRVLAQGRWQDVLLEG